MELAAFQRAAQETSRLKLGGPQAAIAPMLGLASETGSILNVYRKYLRDGFDLAANREFLREELGDLLVSCSPLVSRPCHPAARRPC